MGKGGATKDSNAWKSLQRFDAFPKVNEDFFQRTLSGGVITLLALGVMCVLFFSELRLYLTVNTDYELSVDSSRGEQMRINLDVSFPNMPCSVISLDVMDVSGDQELDVSHHIMKRRLSAKGTPISPGEKEDVNSNKMDPEEVKKRNEKKDGKDEGNVTATDDASVAEIKCGSCYGSEQTPEQCCNSCEEVRESYRLKGWAFSDPEHITLCQDEGFSEKLKLQSENKEGCSIYGYLDVNKVAGNFHFAPGKSFQHGNMHVHDLMPFHTNKFDMSHTIKKLSFGADFPGVVNPLDNVKRHMSGDAGMYQYFLKVVPTVFEAKGSTRFGSQKTTSTNQFSVTDHFKSVDAGEGAYLPGVFFFYDLSPIKITMTERLKTFTSFLTSVFAIVGGAFAVSAIIDSFVFHGGKALRKKIDLGKQG